MEEQYGNLDLVESPPYSSLFEGYGMDSLNFINNSGSYFFFLGLIPTVLGVKFIINLIALYFRRYEFARQVGMYVYDSDKSELMMMAFKKLVMETFTDLCICSFLQMIYYYNHDDIV